MFGVPISLVLFLSCVGSSVSLVPAKFQWKTIDFAWEGDTRAKAIADGSFVPENNMPTGMAIWRYKYLLPYPDGKKVVDDSGGCGDTFAYVTDMGANALSVLDLRARRAWRVEHPFFHFDPVAGVYRVGGVDFFWSDGVSSAALSKKNSDGFRDLFLHPTSSTKLFKMSTKVLKNRNATDAEKNNAVQIVGDRGPNSQATACDLDPKTNILFFTQLSKNGTGCWNVKMECSEETTPLVISDCNLLEFPSDIKVDSSENLWVLSNRQSRFLYDSLDYSLVNFRILTAPVASVVEDSACVKKQKNKQPSCSSISSQTPTKKPSKLRNLFSGSKSGKK